MVTLITSTFVASSWVQSPVLTTPIWKLWRQCSGSCPSSSSLSPSTSPRSVCLSLASVSTLFTSVFLHLISSKYNLNLLNSLSHSVFKVFFSSSNKPQAVFTYWTTSNFFSLGQVALLRHPFVRQKLGIPERIKHPESALPQNEGFIKSMKKGWWFKLLKPLTLHYKFKNTLIYFFGCVSRLEERTAGSAAAREGTKDQKSSGPRCQRSVPPAAASHMSIHSHPHRSLAWFYSLWHQKKEVAVVSKCKLRIERNICIW